MYLLIPQRSHPVSRSSNDLHSIMYLLIPKAFSVWICISLFTFHNVSINSNYGFILIPILLNLHSIMYLLIRSMSHKNKVSLIFTFHNVSINSRTSRRKILLIFSFTFHNVSINSEVRTKETFSGIKFTFHNVSINSCFRFPHFPTPTEFTFHNVSINSHLLRLLSKWVLYLHSIMYLLILS